jgi:hypothetical protein
MRIHGKIDGQADIWGAELKTNTVMGTFEIRQSDAYYHTNYVINYAPKNVHSGTIEIDYAFQ